MCKLLHRPHGSSGWMILPSLAERATAPFWWTLSGTESWICSPTGTRRRLLPGYEPILGENGSVEIAVNRSSAYAEAAQVAAPEAVQVADRFHLLANLGM